MWANRRQDALLEHFTSMADDPDIPWLEKYKREGEVKTRESYFSVRFASAYPPSPGSITLESQLSREHFMTGDECNFNISFVCWFLLVWRPKSNISIFYFLLCLLIVWGGALKREDFVSIRDELFAVTPLESLDAMDSMMPEMPDGLDDTLDESVYWIWIHLTWAKVLSALAACAHIAMQCLAVQ